MTLKAVAIKDSLATTIVRKSWLITGNLMCSIQGCKIGRWGEEIEFEIAIFKRVVVSVAICLPTIVSSCGLNCFFEKKSLGGEYNFSLCP